MSFDEDLEWEVPLAAARGKHDAARNFLKTSCNEEDRQRVDGETLLHKAAYYGKPDIMKVQVLEHNVNVDAVDKDGQTPLHRAAYNGNPDKVKVLLEHNANVNAVDKNGNTPLHIASRQCQVGAVQLLIQYGADVLTVNKSGETAYDACGPLLPFGRTQDDVTKLKTLLQKAMTEQQRSRRNDEQVERKLADALAVAAEKFLKWKQPDRNERETFTCFTLERNQGNSRSKVKDLQFRSAAMSVKHSYVIRSQYQYLLDNVDIQGMLVPYLYQEGTLERHHIDKIDTETSQVNKIEILLDVLTKRGNSVLHDFCVGLEKNGQDFISKRLSLLCRLPDARNLKDRVVPSLHKGQSWGLGPQRCIGKSTMTVDYHSSLGEAFKSIALIVWGRPLGTGFVVGGNHIMTNCHVVPDHTSVFEVPCAAVFNYNNCPTSNDVMCCMLDPFPVITNPDLDYAILKLEPSQSLHEALATYKKADTIPQPLKKFVGIGDHDKVTFAGHPGAEKKAIDVQCEVYHRHQNPGFRNMHDERKRWSHTNFGRDIFPHFDDPNWVLYHSSRSFSHGSSGSPGFVPGINQEACVAVLHAFAHPDVPQGSTVTVPLHYYIEQGVKIEAICRDLKGKKPALCRDIFGV